MRRLRWPGRYDIDALAGVAAAFVALILHVLHVVEEDVVLAVLLVVVGLLMVRDLRSEARDERVEELVGESAARIARLEAAQRPPEVDLAGPRDLRAASEAFAQRARGDMVWFNVCLLMFRPQPLFDVLLRPAIENPRVASIQFILDHRERERWDQDVMPKVRACSGGGKVREPRWSNLDEAISFILSETSDGRGPEAQVSFWGEPFMARQANQNVPRYVFHVHAHSDLINQLIEMERRYRLMA